MRFQYTALDRKGDEIAGEIYAADDVEALEKLRKTGVYPIRLSEKENDSRINPGAVAEKKSKPPEDNGKNECSSPDDSDYSEEGTVVIIKEVDNHALPEALLINEAYDRHRSDDNPSQRAWHDSQKSSTWLDDCSEGISDVESLKTLLVVFLFGALAVAGIRYGWIYLGWFGLLGMILIIFVGGRFVMRGLEEDWGFFGFLILFVIVGNLCIKVPRSTALAIWRDSGNLIGGSDWVSDPRFAPPPTFEEQIDQDVEMFIEQFGENE